MNVIASAKPCVIGLDEPEYADLRNRCDVPFVAYETLPRIVVNDGALFVESKRGFGFVPASRIVYHAIFENDHDWIAGLALWGGPCLPNARAMMDCRLKLPCLARALAFTRFGSPPRGFASPDAKFDFGADAERVAKWGNWHCGENKARFRGDWRHDDACIIERFLEGQAIRVVVIGDQAWQIRLEGNSWLKSIHHADARFMDPDERLVADTKAVANGFGLELAANDYIVTPDGEPHLLEVNHIPNVTRFPEIWEAYARFIVAWLERQP